MDENLKKSIERILKNINFGLKDLKFLCRKENETLKLKIENHSSNIKKELIEIEKIFFENNLSNFENESKLNNIKNYENFEYNIINEEKIYSEEFENQQIFSKKINIKNKKKSKSFIKWLFNNREL